MYRRENRWRELFRTPPALARLKTGDLNRSHLLRTDSEMCECSLPSRLSRGIGKHNVKPFPMHAHRSATRITRERGFSLVEIALAVAVLGIAMAGLIALLPSGVGQFQTAMDTTITAQIAQRILDDAQQSEYDLLIDRENLPLDPAGSGICPEGFSFRAPKVNAGKWRYFDSEGTEFMPKARTGRLSAAERGILVYQATVRIRPRAELPAINETTGSVAQITVQIARNPGGIELPLEGDPLSPEHNLFKRGLKVAVFTFPALVGRNNGR